ncbi:cyclic peptide export ABC transporter [Hymenobacter sp. BT664]|uniref:Cyclic peptide export ABC transporter n=1 Tax=Hymenobacter montanus TaxID=2771359 RepID=A0A927GIB0_9BACT|nr:cyclic peptide export ABC transporter [Hymenobacter montanus]MBD2767185.1 cyclic peptide export ABC transporter [Hymenobacter montanus]
MKLIKFLKRHSPYFTYQLFAIGIMAGLAETGAIAIINEVIRRSPAGTDFYPKLLLGFVIAVTAYIFIQKYSQQSLIKLAENIIWKARLSIIDDVRQSDFEQYENYGSTNIYTALSRDVGRISEFATLLPSAVIALVTTVGCLGYLLWLSWVGFVFTALIIGVLVAIYFLQSKRAVQDIEEARRVEATFFEHLNDLLAGVKEVKMDSSRNSDLYTGYLSLSARKAEKILAKSNISFVTISIIYQLSFFVLVGLAIFLLPFLKISFFANTSQFVLVILYMIGPIQGLTQIIPTISFSNVAVKQIESITQEIASMKEVLKTEPPTWAKQHLAPIVFDRVCYTYENKQERRGFQLGPLSMKINPGEIVFISGGNGSGKSTFVKLLTGLYRPTEGTIWVNDHPVSADSLQAYRELYAPIYTDNYLFKRLYGQAAVDPAKVNALIQKLGLANKVTFVDNAYSTLDLSQGQKKRLALISALMEDKPVYVFDEWAANQDPEFKEYFYRQLLPELSDAGKTVFVITHDDRYFSVADRHFHMEAGKLLENQVVTLS